MYIPEYEEKREKGRNTKYHQHSLATNSEKCCWILLAYFLLSIKIWENTIVSLFTHCIECFVFQEVAHEHKYRAEGEGAEYNSAP